MIKFDKLWLVMEQKGVTTYALREKGGIDSKTIRRLRNNENMDIAEITVDTTIST